jgi:Cu-processing system ATP-binding protein
MYLQDGKMVFFQSMGELQSLTQEEKLGKAIAKIMRNEKKDALWIEEVLAVGTGKKS